jgi:predicted outer membrane repeat protein
MLTKKMRIATAATALGAMAVFGAPPAPALAQPVISVPCSSAALAATFASINGSASPTVSLAQHCRYVLTQGLVTLDGTADEGPYTFLGNDATLVRSHAPGTGQFALISCYGPLTVNDLNFSNGNPAINMIGYGNLTVNGGTFAGNHGAGAIFMYNQGNGPTVKDATFIGNTSTGNGGAIFDFAFAAGAYVADSRFYDNHAGNAGGAMVEASGPSEFVHDVFEGNSAGVYGGALFDATGSVIADSQFLSNDSGSQGGAIFCGNSGSESLNSDLIEGNSAPLGGGVYNYSGQIYLNGGLLYGNHAASDGGGMYNAGQQDLEEDITMSGATVSDNSAGDQGGGIYNTGTLAASHSRIIGNQAASGGGIYGTGVTLTDTPVLFNRPDNCAPAGSVPGCTG